jgi:hypothetical protein
MPRPTRKQLAPKPPADVLRTFNQLHEWRRAVLGAEGLTGRDKAIGLAHASMVERLSDGQPRIHWASNATLTRRAGYRGDDAARVASLKLVQLGLLLRLRGPSVRATSYSYLLRVVPTAPQDQD